MAPGGVLLLPLLHASGVHMSCPTLAATAAAAAATAIAEDPKRARQLYSWMYGPGRLVRSLDEADGHARGFSVAFKNKVQYLPGSGPCLLGWRYGTCWSVGHGFRGQGPAC